MANTFKNKTSKGVGTSFFHIGSANPISGGGDQTGAYTVAASTQTTVIGLSVSNITGSSVDVDVQLSSNAGSETSDIRIVKGIPIPSGSTVVLIGGDQKLVMETGNLLKIKSSAASSLDVVMSILEIT